MNPETNRIEYKQERIDDLEKEVVAFSRMEEKDTVERVKGNSPQNLDKFWRAIYYEINR